jgi:phospholipid transport system substrate-binding protein
MTRRIPFIFALGLAWTAMLAPAGLQAQSASQARQFLERKHDSVMSVLRQKPSSSAARQKRADRLGQMLDGLLDYEELSRRALDEHWKERSAEERDKFVELLKQLVERSYRKNLEQTLDYQVRYQGERTEGEGVLVETTARSKSNRRAPPISIDYRLKRTGGQWRVFDVITDGVSMVDNYRNQFDRIIEKDGWNGLLERMQSKLEG